MTGPAEQQPADLAVTPPAQPATAGTAPAQSTTKPPEKSARRSESIGHLYVGTAWLGPVGGVVGVVTARAFNADIGTSTAVGVAVWVSLWAFAAWFYAAFTTPAKANPRSYGELRNKLAKLDARRHALCDVHTCCEGAPDPNVHTCCEDAPDPNVTTGNAGAPDPNVATAKAGAPDPKKDVLNRATAESACSEAKGYLDWVRGQMHGPGELRWVNGAGYIDLWQRAHRAEEALLMATPKEQLFDEELYDELRLRDSAIPNRDDLMGILRAIKRYLCGTAPDPSDTVCIDSLEKAASALKNVRFSINDFRDSSWNGLLQVRNQTMTTLLLTNITLFAIADAVVISGASKVAILSATVFFLTGSAVGFFNRLNSQFQAKVAVEDYGLTSARIVAIPAYSGLAAVAGVVITSVAGVATGSTAPALGMLFKLPPDTLLLVVSAVFGAAPDLVLSRLGDASEKFKNGIASTEPGNRQP